MTKRVLVVTESGLAALQRYPLTKAEAAVLWHIAHSLSANGDFVSMARWAKELKMSHVHVVNSVAKLVKLGFVVRGGKHGTSYHFKLNVARFSVL